MTSPDPSRGTNATDFIVSQLPDRSAEAPTERTTPMTDPAPYPPRAMSLAELMDEYARLTARFQGSSLAAQLPAAGRLARLYRLAIAEYNSIEGGILVGFIAQALNTTTPGDR